MSKCPFFSVFLVNPKKLIFVKFLKKLLGENCNLGQITLDECAQLTKISFTMESIRSGFMQFFIITVKSLILGCGLPFFQVFLRFF